MALELTTILNAPIFRYNRQTAQTERLILSEINILKIPLIGIYHGAHWCNPCQQFIPYLIQLYNFLNREGKIFEIIYISHDVSDSQWKNSIAQMPWLAFSRTSAESLHSCANEVPTLKILTAMSFSSISQPKWIEKQNTPTYHEIRDFKWIQFVRSRIWTQKPISEKEIIQFSNINKPNRNRKEQKEQKEKI